MSFNTAMIRDRYRQVRGSEIDEREAQRIMSATGGGDENRVWDYLRNDPGYLAQKSADQARADKAAQDRAAAAKQAQWVKDRAAFDTKQKKEGQEFVTGFKEDYPTILSDIETELNLPQLRTATQTGFQQLEDLPGGVTEASQGRDVSANQLERMIASRQGELYPELQRMMSGQQFAEEEFGRRAERELTPYNVEFQQLSDQWAREASGFNIDMQGQLNVLIQQMQSGVQLSVAEMNQAVSLAQLEAQKERLQMEIDAGSFDSDSTAAGGINTVDLGNRKLILDDSGNLISSYQVGLGPKRAGTGKPVNPYD